MKLENKIYIKTTDDKLHVVTSEVNGNRGYLFPRMFTGDVLGIATDTIKTIELHTILDGRVVDIVKVPLTKDN